MTASRFAVLAAVASAVAWGLKAVAIGIAGGLDESPLESPLFVLGLVVRASLFAGGLPALHASRVSAGAALKDDSRSSTSGRLGRFSSGLVIAELAVSCGLLIAAGLMIKSVVQLRTVPMPFAIDGVLTARVDLPRENYRDSAASIRFFEELLPKLRAVPGVEAAT